MVRLILATTRSDRHMCRTLAPEQVICYGRPFREMFGLAAVVEVPYSRETRTSERIARRRADAQPGLADG